MKFRTGLASIVLLGTINLAHAATYTGVVNEIQAVTVGGTSVVRYEDSVGFNPGVFLWTANTSLNQALVPLFFCKAAITFTYTPNACPSGLVPGKSCGVITSFTAASCY